MRKKEKLTGIFTILSLVLCFAAFVLWAGDLFDGSVALTDRLYGLNSGLYLLFICIGLVLFAVYMLKAEKNFPNLNLLVCAFALFTAVDFGYAYMSFTAPALFDIKAVSWAVCGLLVIFSTGSLVSVMLGLKARWLVLVYGVLNILLPVAVASNYVLDVLENEDAFLLPSPLFCIEVLGGLFFGIAIVIFSTYSVLLALFGGKKGTTKTASAGRICPKCGALVEGDSLFCSECGTNVGNSAPVTAAAEETGASKSCIVLTRIFSILLVLVLFAAAAGCLYFASNALYRGTPEAETEESENETEIANLFALLDEVSPTDSNGGFLGGPVYAIGEGKTAYIAFDYAYPGSLYAFAPEGITFEWMDFGCRVDGDKAGIYTLSISTDKNSDRKGVQAVIIVYSDEIPASKPVETKEDDDAYTTFIDTLMYVIGNGLYPFWM